MHLLTDFWSSQKLASFLAPGGIFFCDAPITVLRVRLSRDGSSLAGFARQVFPAHVGPLLEEKYHPALKCKAQEQYIQPHWGK